MEIDIDKLHLEAKKKYSFKYKPEFSESFSTKIKDGQIIPLSLKVFEKLGWEVVFVDEKSAEAKRKSDWGKFTEKITVTVKTAGRVEVHSKTLEGHFIDFGKNSMRVSVFIALFQKLGVTYEESGELTEIQEAHEKRQSWDDYEVPTELPKPVDYGKPNFTLSIIGGLVLAVAFGVVLGRLTIDFGYIILLYEFLAGIFIGYLFAQVLKKTNYFNYKETNILLGCMMLVMLLSNLFTQYITLIGRAPESISFFKYLELLFDNGLTVDGMDVGGIGLIISWLIQLIVPYFTAQLRVNVILMKDVINRVPDVVMEYTIYLFEMQKTESEVRAELAQKGWNRDNQEYIFHAVSAVIAFKEDRRGSS